VFLEQRQDGTRIVASIEQVRRKTVCVGRSQQALFAYDVAKTREHARDITIKRYVPACRRGSEDARAYVTSKFLG
jgi:hypothetical protein